MIGQWFRYGGQLYQVHETPGAFPHSPVRYTAVLYEENGFCSNEDDPWAILELVMRGVRVNEDGSQYMPLEQEPLLKAIADAETEGWLVKTGEGCKSSISQTEAAAIILPAIGADLTKDPARALRDRLKRAGFKIIWGQKRG